MKEEIKWKLEDWEEVVDFWKELFKTIILFLKLQFVTNKNKYFLYLYNKEGGGIVVKEGGHQILISSNI